MREPRNPFGGLRISRIVGVVCGLIHRNTQSEVPQALRRHVALVSALLFSLSAQMLFAQTTSATLTGRISDPSGAAVPDASVTLTDTGTDTKRTTRTNGEGLYTITQLPPAHYNLSVTHAGFSTSARADVSLEVNQTANVSVALAVGSENTTVEVTGSAPILGTDNVSLGTVVDEKQVSDLPLNGRQFAQLLQLVPGVVPVSVGQSLTPAIGGGADISPGLDGQSNRANLTFIDGVLTTDSLFSSFTLSPSIDAIDAFQVQSHAADAQFGQSTGGTINVATKAGTNHIHGTAYEFFRNQDLNAISFYSPTKQPFQLNDFGGTLGGPILRDKLFLFGYYEGVRQTLPQTSQSIVPTAAELGGDFSDQAATIYDPATYNSATNSTQPFAGNKIDPTRLNQGVLAALKAYVPPPNLTNSGSSNNYINTEAGTVTADQYGIRADYSITPRDLVYGRFIINREVSISPQSLAGNAFLLTYNDKNLSVNYVHSFSPTLTAQITGGFNYFDYPLYDVEPGAQSVFNTAGFAAGFTSTPGGIGLPYIPGIHPSGAFSLASGWGGQGQNDSNIKQISGNVNKQLGAHALKFGTAFYSTTEAGNFAEDDEYFSQQATQNPCASQASGQCVGGGGNSLASLLLGLPVSASRTLGSSLNVVHSYIYGVFAQDTWKVSDKLTVNYGLRWDYTTPPTEEKDRFSYFDYRTGIWFIAPGNPAAPSLLPAGVQFSSTKQITSPDYKNISPRLGFSFLLTPITVLRVGAGAFYDNWAGILQGSQNNRGAWPNGAQQSVSNINIAGLTPGTSAQNPFGTLQPIEPATPFPSSGSFLDPKFREADSWQYNAELQQQLGKAGVFSMAYVGSSTARTPITLPANVAHTLQPTLVVPFPNMSQFNSVQSTGHAKYNALQSKFQESTKVGLSFLGSFTWSHTFDVGCSDIFVNCQIQNPYDLKADEADSSIDIPIVLNLSAAYELPFGRGKRFLTSGAAAHILGGFQLNSIFLTRSGTVFTPTINFDNANANGGSERPNVVGDPHGSAVAGTYFNTTAYQLPQQYTYGDAGRNSLRGPRFTNVDFSLFRTFTLPHEFGRAEFRAETFNLFNHPNLGNPDATLEDPNFGIISSTASAYNPREIQLAVKFIF